MAYQYVDLNTGSLIFLNDRIAEGLNTDVNGKDYHFAAQGYLYVDPSGPVVNGYLALLAEGVMVGRDLTVTNVRAGARYSIDPATGSIAANTPDQFVLNGLYAIGAMNGATNLVTPVLTAAGWTNAGNATASEPSANVYRITHDGGGDDFTHSIASAARNGTISCQVRLISGTPSALDVIQFMNGATPVGTPFDLSTVTSAWTTVEASVTSAATSDKVSVFYGSTFESVIEFRFVRAVASTVAHPAFADGSAAGATHGTDIHSCSPSWTPAGTIVQAAISYGYSGAGNPASSLARFFHNANLFFAEPGAATAYGSGGVPSIATGGSVVDGQVSVLSADWNGTVIGARWGSSFARDTAVEADTPTGTLYIGDFGDTTRPFHGALVTWIFDRVLTDAEFAAIRAGLTDRLSAFVAGGFR